LTLFGDIVIILPDCVNFQTALDHRKCKKTEAFLRYRWKIPSPGFMTEMHKGG
jgi:hypothetical protein